MLKKHGGDVNARDHGEHTLTCASRSDHATSLRMPLSMGMTHGAVVVSRWLHSAYVGICQGERRCGDTPHLGQGPHRAFAHQNHVSKTMRCTHELSRSCSMLVGAVAPRQRRRQVRVERAGGHGPRPRPAPSAQVRDRHPRGQTREGKSLPTHTRNSCWTRLHWHLPSALFFAVPVGL